jgi:pyruvate,orthophosphate dikinase
MEHRTATARGVTIREGDVISIDGGSGEVLVGAIPAIAPQADELEELNFLLGWADDVRRLEVWANADTPVDAERARQNGAQGIGLCRTEHMFFPEERLPHIQRLLEVGPYASRLIREAQELDARLAQAPASEREALTLRLQEANKTVESSRRVSEFHAELANLEKFQYEDFYGILKVMHGLPVVIRLLDAPLHEFLPNWEDLLVEEHKLEAAGKKEELEELKRTLELVESLRESNPMLGNRGCRVGLMMPEIYEMQVRAIVTAACKLTQEGFAVAPEIMIPIVSHVNELKWLRPRLRAIASKTREALGAEMTYKFGAMIEVPRAALTAGEIAANTEFFSFGSNDLTQMTFAYSRDDAEGKFLNQYVDTEILPWNPFNSLDVDGVGRLMRLAVEEGRAVKPDLPIGICGEHGGDPRSIAFCNELGLNYVSASPFRVPVARLAAAQSELGHLKPNK